MTMMWHTIEVVFISVWGDPTYHVVNVLTAVARHRLCRQMPLRRERSGVATAGGARPQPRRQLRPVTMTAAGRRHPPRTAAADMAVIVAVVNPGGHSGR